MNTHTQSCGNTLAHAAQSEAVRQRPVGGQCPVGSPKSTQKTLQFDATPSKLCVDAAKHMERIYEQPPLHRLQAYPAPQQLDHKYGKVELETIMGNNDDRRWAPSQDRRADLIA